MTPKEAPKRKYSPLFALERIKNIPVHTTYGSFVKTYASTDYKDEIEVIEYALNRLEELETQQFNTFGARMNGKTSIISELLMSLEALEKENKSLTKELKKQDKELVGLTQVLKIIKDKNCLFEGLKNVSQQEFDLLKEYLK